VVAEKEPLTDLHESKGFLRFAKLLVVEDISSGAGGLLDCCPPPSRPLAESGGFCEKYDEFIFLI
jgi:hypothetical protein